MPALPIQGQEIFEWPSRNTFYSQNVYAMQQCTHRMVGAICSESRFVQSLYIELLYTESKSQSLLTSAVLISEVFSKSCSRKSFRIVVSHVKSPSS